MCAVAAMFSPGDAVGDYVIEQRLGAGGFGEVFLAAARSPKRRVALKFVRPEFAANPLFVQRFEREADAMAAVEHPNVVTVYSHGVERGLPYFSMHYVSGGSLDTFLDARDPALDDVLELLAGVADGLDHCHARGIVHRDLKPANVLVDSECGRGLLADFGIATADELSTLTSPGGRVGTPAYMAPETLMGARATPESDRWALAAVAYRAATGRLPRGSHQSPDAEPVPPSRHSDCLGPDVDRVLLRGLSLDPARRYPDAHTFIAELRAAVERPSHRRRLTRPASPKRGFAAAGAVLVLLPAAVYGLTSFGEPNCHTSYVGECLNPDSLDYDCQRGSGNGPDFVSGRVQVIGPDDFELDQDGDGFAC